MKSSRRTGSYIQGQDLLRYVVGVTLWGEPSPYTPNVLVPGWRWTNQLQVGKRQWYLLKLREKKVVLSQRSRWDIVSAAPAEDFWKILICTKSSSVTQILVLVKLLETSSFSDSKSMCYCLRIQNVSWPSWTPFISGIILPLAGLKSFLGHWRH